MPEMRRLLIVTYDFPPSPVGIWRTLKFCRYMGDFGWQPAILTVKTVRAPRWDLGPLEELPPGTPVRRTGSLDPFRLAWLAGEAKGYLLPMTKNRAARSRQDSVNPRPTHSGFRSVMDIARRWLLIPDDKAGWIPFAVPAGYRWLHQTRFDAIYSTSFPNTSHVAGTILAKATGLPYLADFRDSWTGNYYFYNPATKLHDKIHRTLEAATIHRAGRVVSVTRPITEDFLSDYPDEPREKFVTIPNGFDPVDFADVRPNPHPGVFTIAYVGTMYGQTSPKAFLLAVRRLLKRRPEWRTVLRLRFVGAMIEPYRQMIARAGLESITSTEPYLPHDEALQVMADADAFLLIVAPVPGSRIMLTQKVFEYAAARRPILGLVPDSAARDFLEEIGEGWIAPPGDPAAIESRLEEMLTEWHRHGRRELPPNPRLAAYERRELTRRLCRELDAIAGD